MNLFEKGGLSLNKLRGALIRMEDTITFALIERAQFQQQPKIYEKNAFSFPDFDGSFMEYFLWETEKTHAKARRYTSPDENSFFDDLPSPVLPAIDFPAILKPNDVNCNKEILDVYVRQMVPALCPEGDETGNYGSAATRDVECLQALSRRIHYGKFIAEAKFSNPENHLTYVELIRKRDTDGIMELLTNKAVEEKLLKRLRKKALMYGADIDAEQVDTTPDILKVDPSVVVDIYEKWVIPLTKKVEVEYLLKRLDRRPSTPDVLVDDLDDGSTFVSSIQGPL